MSAAPDIAPELGEQPATVTEAAHALGVKPRTVREWIARGAPVRRPGEPGRGRGALVSIPELRAWRAGGTDRAVVLERVGEALLDALRREADHGLPAHALRGIPVSDAAVLYLTAYQRIYRALVGEWPEAPYPEAVERLFDIAETGADMPVLRDFEHEQD